VQLFTHTSFVKKLDIALASLGSAPLKALSGSVCSRSISIRK